MRKFWRLMPLLAGLLVSACSTEVQTTGTFVKMDPSEDEVRAAFYYAYPIYELTRLAQDRTGAVDGKPGRLNELVHRAQLLDHTSRQVTGPNNDTIYSSAFLELSKGPVELHAPTSHDRYFSIAFMNALTDNFAYIGTRETGGEGGTFWIVGPNWQGDAPEGVGVIRSDSNLVWMLARILVDGPADLENAIAFQQQILIEPLEGAASPRPFEIRADGELTAEKMLSVVNMMLDRSPGGHGQFDRAAEYSELGVGDSKFMLPEVMEAWAEFLPTGLAELKEAFIYRDFIIDGWAYQEEGVGDFGTNDKLRAAVALGGIAALGEKEAMYFHANLDPDGNRLNGANKYRWRIPEGGVPADAFWSLTMYETYPDGKFFLVESPINRYSIGDRTMGLKVEPDGSFEILIQHDAPADDMISNWLPAPEGNFRLALRAYMPREPLLKREWQVPPLEKIE